MAKKKRVVTDSSGRTEHVVDWCFKIVSLLLALIELFKYFFVSLN